MVTLKIVESILVLLVAHTSKAQEALPSHSPAATAPAQEQAPGTQGAKPTDKLEPSSAPVDAPRSESTALPMVDPDLAAAAEQDVTSKQGTASAPSIEPDQPVIMPMAKLNPDISFILDMGLGWFNRDQHLRRERLRPAGA
jgi:hypothetical protein